jgi:hypothetical protein
MRLAPSCRRNGPPSCAAKRIAPCHALVIHRQQVVNFLQRPRRLFLPFGGVPSVA